ncbi:TRAP transporter substrate-binding protein [Variovorax dokdonensis]|uniref:TRAP transporter substrate-binding protein n=1 Tax=Variovorax dokdonensis TaxID=344883 RepID=A0ABT7N777_9BURK|nr:TRAP transporter substrate-binding protein [Variovorax dokdonensis]MDM0043798.1 TRAP transporter substrate-binding protein [Variovorax dokdonensis]
MPSILHRRLRASRAALALAAALAALACAPAVAQDKPVNLKMSSWVPAQHPLNPALQAWADDIKKASGGTITATLFPSEQLGKAFDHYDMARDGIADLAYVNPGYQPGRFPIMAGASLPFLFSNGKSGSAAIDAWYRQYAAKEMKDIKVCFAFVHDPGTFHARKKITLPTDINGMKIRPATSTIGQMVTLLGGTNVQASAPAARDALEKGVADAITFPWGSIILFGIDKVVKYHIDVPLYVTPFVWGMNKDKYESMSAAQKKVIDDHCTSEWAEKVAANWADYEAAGKGKIAAEAGHEVYKLTPEQLDAWRKAVAPVEGTWAEGVKKTGEDPKAVLDNLKASLVKYKAAL